MEARSARPRAAASAAVADAAEPARRQLPYAFNHAPAPMPYFTKTKRKGQCVRCEGWYTLKANDELRDHTCVPVTHRAPVLPSMA